MEYVRHLEAGRKAAKYVMYRWPNTFRFKKLDSVSEMFSCIQCVCIIMYVCMYHV